MDGFKGREFPDNHHTIIVALKNIDHIDSISQYRDFSRLFGFGGISEPIWGLRTQMLVLSSGPYLKSDVLRFSENTCHYDKFRGGNPRL
jgi:hypothetical protein